MKRKKWFTFAAAFALTGAATLMMYGCVRGYSESRDGKVSWSDTEPAVVLAAAGSSKTVPGGGKENGAAGKTDAGQTSSVKKENTPEDRYDRNWLGHPAEDFVMPDNVKILYDEEKDSVEKHKEDMSEQEAAETGLRWLYAVYGYDPSGQTVEVSLKQSVPNRRFWSGFAGKGNSRDSYTFFLDSVSGKPIMLNAPLNNLNRDQDEKLFSIRDLTYLYDNLYWSKIIRRFLEQTGLPMGKTVNTVKAVDIHEGVVGLSCIYNEMSGDRETVNIGYDFVTNEVLSYYNKTAMEEKQK